MSLLRNGGVVGSAGVIDPAHQRCQAAHPLNVIENED